MDDKELLLNELRGTIEPEQQIGKRPLIVLLLILSLLIVILFPKIYLINTIYYKSREVITLEREYSMLKEENRILRSKVEKKHFKNRVLDTMF